ncbi:BamA/TamA family outer membrane protein [Fulvivirgaceae bacterium BMA10]|uniref:BamA/TamA family outer membrane protein n=1 Tax=Splendidivirga corallicola TaxID=3051826 RepID=A0ABT8KPH1_9BACT|nr:BamA/TamA family outer membrane protein [Fulvivirgaceae bacterium BMA10]
MIRNIPTYRVLSGGSLLFFVFFLSFSAPVQAQVSEQVADLILDQLNNSDIKNDVSSSDVNFFEISDILVFGNDKTKEDIIFRELDITKGQTVLKSELEDILETNRKKIFNTSLFLSVEMEVLERPSNKIDIVIKVSERWYIFPVPLFKLDARNFNDWWTNHNRDFSRVSYGIRFYQYNLRGRNERLKLTAQFGFTNVLQLSYRVPYIDRAKRNGLTINVGYNANKKINYKTEDHVPVVVDFGKRTRESRYALLTFSHRPSFYNFHFFTVGYQHYSINDSIAILNPDFFLNGRTEQKYFRLRYQYRKDYRDIAAYPLSGYLFTAEAEKIGLGIYNDINMFEVDVNYYKYFKLKNNVFISTRLAGNISFPNRQPYINFRGLGYRPNFIRGYELNVIDGQSFLLNKITLKKRLLSIRKKFNNLIKKDQFQTIPLDIYLKTYYDSGIVNNSLSGEQNERLSNKYLYGTGIGLDFVTYYDFVIRCEYSINSSGEHGFFLNFKSDLR